MKHGLIFLIGVFVGGSIIWLLLDSKKITNSPSNPIVKAPSTVETPATPDLKVVPFSDEFNATQLDSRWVVHGKNREVNLSDKPGYLNIKNAFVAQEPINYKTFTVEAKLDFFPSGKSQSIALGVVPLKQVDGFIHLKLYSPNGKTVDCHTWQFEKSECLTPNMHGMPGGTYFFRIVREGNKVTSYCSTDGYIYNLIRQCDISNWGTSDCKLEIMSFNHEDDFKAGKLSVDYFRVGAGVAHHPTVVSKIKS